MSRKFLIAASLFAAFAAQAAQNDPQQQRFVLESEGVGQVLPAATQPAKAPRVVNGLFVDPTLKTETTRAAVIAELVRARAQGELQMANEEIGHFALPQVQLGETRLARYFKR